MRRTFLSIALAGLACSGLVYAADTAKPAAAAAAASSEPKTEDDKIFYALGAFLASRFQLNLMHLKPGELDMIRNGLFEVASGKSSQVDLATYVPKVQELAKQRTEAAKSEVAAAEKKKGKEFLTPIAAKEGVRKTGTGLLIETIAEGSGATPTPTDTVKVNYKGTTIDGKEFDASAKHGGPSTFKLDGSLIQCWKEAFQFIKPGGKAKLYCPSELSYGDNGNGPDIPPGATLIFEVELVEIVKPEVAKP